MNTMRIAAAAALVMAGGLTACGESDMEASGGVDGGGDMAAFDGETLDGWHPVAEAEWSVEDGLIVGTGTGSGFLATDADYEDFKLTLDFRVAEGENSGVYFRCQDMDAVSDSTCYEVNIYDNRPDRSGRTAGIPHLAPPSVVIDAGNEWNTFEITAEGSHITVLMNGQETVSVETGKDSEASSPIMLQVGADTVMEFRNISIEEL